MKKFFLPLLLVVVVFIIAEIPAGMADLEVNDDFDLEPVSSVHVIGFLYALLVLPVIQYGMHFLFLKSARNETFEVMQIFDGFKMYMNVVLANILMMALVGLGLLVFVVPGIYILCRLAFVPYVVMDLKLGPVEAIKKSWELTRGQVITVLGMVLLAIPIIIGGLMLVIVGVIFAVMWIFCSFAGLYHAITSGQQIADTVGDPQVISS